MNVVVWPDQPAPWIKTIRDTVPNVEIVTPSSDAEALAAAPQAEGWIGKLTPELLASAQRVRWLQSVTTSMESIIFPELVARETLTLTKLSHIYDDYISTHALTLFLSLCRDFPKLMRRQVKHEWTAKGAASGTAVVAAHLRYRANVDVEVRDPGSMTVLVVGLGGIGTELSRRLAFLGATVIGVDPRVTVPPPGVSEVVPPSRMAEQLGKVDATLVCAPLTPETKGLFDEAMFRKMKPTALFVNVGRGQIVKLAAIERALSEGWISGAGMDVFETEPLPPESPLWDMERVIITPHLAWVGAPHTQERQLAVVVENLRRFAAGDALVNVVDKTIWY